MMNNQESSFLEGDGEGGGGEGEFLLGIRYSIISLYTLEL